MINKRRILAKIGIRLVIIIQKIFLFSIEVIQCTNCGSFNMGTVYRTKKGKNKFGILIPPVYRITKCFDCEIIKYHMEKRLKTKPKIWKYKKNDM